MQAKDSAAMAYSSEPQVLSVSVLKSGAMSILQALADLGIISIRKEIIRCGVPIPEGEEKDPFSRSHNIPLFLYFSVPSSRDTRYSKITSFLVF